MKKEIDTYRLDSLFEVFKRAILCGWYLFGALIAVTLWFFPLTGRIQMFAFLGILIVYSLLSTALVKVEQVRQELKG